MKLLVVDGNSILNRAYYGIRPLTTKDGQFTNAIYGFLTMFNKIKADTDPDRVAIAFDLKSPTFRHLAYSGYKAQRKGMPTELASQMQPLKDLLVALGYKLVTCEGYEADDILGTLSRACESVGGECVIATGDRDSLQLVTDKTTVRLAATKQGSPTAIIYDKAEIMDKYGVEPSGLIEIKAIQGDSSDNIPGVAGIGEKGAGDLIKKFGTIKYIYDNIDTIDVKDSIRLKLTASKDNAVLSRMLGEICCTAPIDTDMDSYKVGEGDIQSAVQMMTKLELFSLIDKMGLKDIKITANEDKAGADNKVKLNVIYNKIPQNCDVVAVFPIFDNDREVTAIYVCDGSNVYVSSDRADIIGILTSNCRKVVYNSKEIFAYLDRNNLEFANVEFDVMLGAYLLNPSSSDYAMDRLCAEYEVDISTINVDNYVDNVDNVVDNSTDYIILCYCLLRLWDKISAKLKEYNQDGLLRDIEIPLAQVLAEMENSGFKVDRDGIKSYGDNMESMMNALQKEIYESVGYEFNIKSPQQLGVALFEKLGLPAKKKTQRGYSTNAEVLEELRYAHPVVDMVLKYRTYAKLKSTYCDGLLKLASQAGKIHTNFNQTETRTGRISSTEPNLQNIPVRTEIGKEMRKFFCAGEGNVLVDADYSQIELRVLAHIANDKNMIEAFKSGVDIHTVTASQVFNIPTDMVTPIMRSRAKAVNFGIVYGIGAFSLAKDIGVTNREASNYIKAYLEHYSGVDKYMQEVIANAKEYGYVQTMFNRRRYLPELTATNKITQAFGQRVARNMPIQGTAADIIKIAMIKVRNSLKQSGLKARLILQVHDELIVECPENEADRVCEILQQEMESAVTLLVPLVADAFVGRTWYDAKG